MLKKLFFVLSISLFCSAQSTIIKGIILDEKSNPIIGANILERDKPNNGTISDFDGNFSLTININSFIEVSYVGFKTQTLKIIDGRNLKIILQDDYQNLDEVTIVAYGKQKKSSVIAAVTTIDPAELRMPTSNLTTSLAGRVAGVISYQRSGEPGRDNA